MLINGDITRHYFISDLHFGHENLIAWERNEFNDVNGHDAYLMNTLKDWAIWHKDEGATLWILGDLGGPLWKIGHLIDWIHNCGNKVGIVAGNHDQASTYQFFEDNCDYFYQFPVYLNSRVLLSHYPQYPLPEGVVNVCGHVHGATLTDEKHYILVSAKNVDYKPYTGKKLQKKLQKVPAASKKFLYEPFAHMYKFTDKTRDDIVCDKGGVVNLNASRELRKERSNQGIEDKPRSE